MIEGLCQALFLLSTSLIQEGREKAFPVSFFGLWLYVLNQNSALFL